MKPSDFVRIHGKEQSIPDLQKALLDFIAIHGDDIEQMKAILDREHPDPATMQRINEYDLEVRIGKEALEQWRNEMRAEFNI